MKITNIQIDHMTEPMGFLVQDHPVVSYQIVEAQGNAQRSVRICVYDAETLVFDSGVLEHAQPVYVIKAPLSPRTRYEVRIAVVSDANEEAHTATWFETGKMDEAWQAQWIAPAGEETGSVPVLGKVFTLEKAVARARLYVGCAGIYTASLGGVRVGDECLTPYCNDYSAWMQIITHDVTPQLCQGENVLELTVAEGWHQGRFGLQGASKIYGDTPAVIAELHVCFADGTQTVLATDASWYARKSCYVSAGIYDGVTLDYTRSTAEKTPVRILPPCAGKLTDRLSLPVRVKHTLPVANVLTTPKGELCLDMGQNMVGWLRIDTTLFADKDFSIRFFEVLDPEGNVYLDNLRSAKQAFVYHTDGRARVTEPPLSFYGFRYAWVEGLDTLPREAFTGCVAYSDMEQTGDITTSNVWLNRLFLNALWGQRGNFVDMPTDCPQRDERLGWTGDAQVFCGTANFNMNTAAFYRKYMYDLAFEQQRRNGAVPHFIPSFQDGEDGAHARSSAAWGDAATVIPWTTYLHSGDKTLLAREYPAMKAWLEYIRRQDSGNRLWDSGFHFGDWLALDTPRPERPLGTTPSELVASAYYLYSATLVSKAAAVLGYAADAAQYAALAQEVRTAMQREFITPTGRVASDTQTANVLALFMAFATDPDRTAADLAAKIAANSGHLNTGFVGTAYLCRALSDHGHNEAAWNLLMRRDYPGWLYEVDKGATTIWERWNSIKPDGSLGDVSMNSYNHYAYGAVVEWLYRNAAGLQPLEEAPGGTCMRLSPQPSPRLEGLNASYRAPQGLYRCEWRIAQDGLHFCFEIPFGGTGRLVLPDAPQEILLNGEAVPYCGELLLHKGIYTVQYMPLKPYFIAYGAESAAAEVMESEPMKRWLQEQLPAFAALPHYVFLEPPTGTLRAYLAGLGVEISDETAAAMRQAWAGIRSWDVGFVS